MKHTFTNLLTRLCANTPPCFGKRSSQCALRSKGAQRCETRGVNHAIITQLSRNNHPITLRAIRYVAVLLMVFMVGIGNVWGTSVTFSAADMDKDSETQTKTPVTCICNTSKGSYQQWKDGSTKKKADGISIGTSADAAVYTASGDNMIQFTIADGYQITSISVLGTSNGSGNATPALLCWTGAIEGNPAGFQVLTLPSRDGSSAPSPVASTSFPAGTKGIGLYKRVKVDDASNPTKIQSSGSATYGGGVTFYAFSVIVNYEATGGGGGTPTHTLTWNLDGGTATGGTAAGSVAEGATLTAPTVTKDGYDFAGWSPNVPSTMPSDDATYTATWTKVYASGTYQFDGNTTLGTAPSKTVTTTTTDYSAFRIDNLFFSTTKIQFEGTDGTPEGDGSNYKGWKIKYNGATNIKFFVENNSDVEVSIGSIGSSCNAKISYTDHGGTAHNNTSISAGSHQTYEAKAGTMVTLALTANGSNSVALKRIKIATPASGFTVTYNGSSAGSGTVPTDGTSYKSGDEVTVLGNTGSLAKSGYGFYGWNTNSNMYGGTHYDAGDKFNITSNTTLYAVWGYAIEYNTDGGTINDASYPLYYVGTGSGSDVTAVLPTDVTKTGYTFSTWKASNGNGDALTQITTGWTGAFSGDYALKAIWTAKQYTVTLNDNGGNSDGSESVTLTYNSASHAAITNPTKGGYTFDGWYSGENGTGTLIIDKTGALQANVENYTGAKGIWIKDAACTLYAKWTENSAPTYSVSAVTSTGNNTYGTVSAAAATAEEGATVVITAVPALGYRVANWAVSGTGATISPSGASNSNTTTLTMGTADATVTVTFEEIPCPTSGVVYSLLLKDDVENASLEKNGGTLNLTSTHVTVTNGASALIKNTDTGTDGKMQIKSHQFYFNGNNAYLKIEMLCALEAGDEIEMTGGKDSREFYITPNECAKPSDDADAVKTSSYKYTVKATDTKLVGVSTLYIGRDGSGTYTTGVKVTRPEKFDVTYSSEKGSAPSATTASSVTLAEITGVSGWKNTGWKANVATEVSGEAVDANTLIANGSVVTLSAATTFTAQWAEYHAITEDTPANGSVDADVATAIAGATISITATPSSGYQFSAWDVYKTGESATKVSVTNNQFTMPDYAVTVSATFVHIPTVDDLVVIDADYTFEPTSSLVANTLYEEGRFISLGDGNPYTSGKGIRIKENRAIAFKVAANAKVKATFVQDGDIEMQLGTATADDDNKAYGHSKTSPKVFDVITTGGVVYLTASNQLDLSKLEIFYPHSVTYALNGGDGTLPTESAHYKGEQFNVHDGETDITAPEGKEFDKWNDGTNDYAAGATYTMGSSNVTLTAQWVTARPLPTITFNDGNYTITGAALDLSTLFSSNSDGEVTYTVKTAGETGAAIDGTNFTATAAGSAVVTASQAATASYKASSVDATITISAPTEVEGIKMVVDGDLTGNFRTSQSLTTLSGDNKYTIAGLNYTKYIKFGSSVSSWSAVAGPSNKYLAYTPTKETTTFYFYVHNNGGASYINLYLIEEGNVTPTKVQVAVAANEDARKSYELTIDKNTEVYITAESNNVYFCQVVAVESGDALLQAPAVDYTMNLNKGRLSTTSNTATTLDGLTFVVSSGYSIASSSNISIGTKGTHYVSFTIPEGQTRQLQLSTSNTNKYTVSKTLGDAENQYQPKANNETKNWNLEAGTWYINPQGSNVQITNIAFAAAPASYTVTFDADGGSSVDAQVIFEDGKAVEPTAPTKSGYDFAGWYNGDDEYDFDAVVTEDLTLTAHWTVHVYNDATLKSLKYGEQSIALEDGVYEYNVELPYYTEGVPALTAVTNSKDAKTPVITNAAALDENNQATSTVSVTSEDATVTLLYQVHFTKVVLYEWQEISGSTNWDFTKAATAQIQLSGSSTIKKDEEAVMANIPGTTNNATFNSQALKFKGEYIYRGDDGTNYPSCASTIKFKTTVPGVVTVRYADNGGNNRCLSINGHYGPTSSSKTDYKTYSVCVPAGEVVLTGHKGSNDDLYMRFFEIDFTAAEDLDSAEAEESTLGGYERTVNPQYYGTVCLPKAGVMTGAMLFQVAYMDYMSDGSTPYKVYYDQVENGVMQAGMPYIFLAEQSTIGVYYTGTTAVAQEDLLTYHGLHGTLVNITEGMNATGIYMLYNNQVLHSTNAASTLPANRAYLQISEIPGYGNPSYVAPAPKYRRISTGFNGANTATGMDEIEASETPMKVMINGQIYIIRGEKMYDVTGKLVK